MAGSFVERHARSFEDLATLMEARSPEPRLPWPAGPALPGASALPAVTILPTASCAHLRAAGKPERWQAGDMLALQLSGSAGEPERKEYFGALGAMSVPCCDVATVEADGTEVVLRVTAHERWDDTVMQFAFLPWSPDRPHEVSAESMAALARTVQPAARCLSVTMEVGSARRELRPEWGLRHAPFRADLEAIRFPLTHAAARLEGFLFRVAIPRRLAKDMGAGGGQPVLLRFRIAPEAVRSTWLRAGLTPPEPTGFSVHANALPLANVDLRAWTPGDAYEEFLRQSDDHPLGIAGVFPYAPAHGAPAPAVRGDADRSDDGLLFDLRLDAVGETLTTYRLVGGEGDRRVLVWTSRGPGLNGRTFAHRRSAPRQPLERISSAFVDSACCLPCFGGVELAADDPHEKGSAARLRIPPVPLPLSHQDGLLLETKRCLDALGYARAAVKRPRTEVRLIDGVRRRVIVLPCRVAAGAGIAPDHLRVLHSFLADRVPFGLDVFVEPEP